jgi:hypothetical protein
MTVHLSPEQERVIGQAIHAGLIRIPDDVVEAGISALRERLAANRNSGSEMGAEEWTQELHAWIHSHSTSTSILSDEAVERDSIYGTRGL